MGDEVVMRSVGQAVDRAIVLFRPHKVGMSTTMDS